MNRLSVWMHGKRIGVLTRTRGRLEFTYSSGQQLGSPLLSVALPVQLLRSPTVHAYFNNLLPEGDARRMLAYDFGQVDPADVMAMLAALGRDCAGALVILPEDEEPDLPGSPEPLRRTRDRRATEPAANRAVGRRRPRQGLALADM